MLFSFLRPERQLSLLGRRPAKCKFILTEFVQLRILVLLLHRHIRLGRYGRLIINTIRIVGSPGEKTDRARS
jgi:hypothetical protein